MRSSIDNKTIRPGLMDYSFYASSRRQTTPQAKIRPTKPLAVDKNKLTHYHLWPVAVCVAIVAGLVIGYNSGSSQSPLASQTSDTSRTLSTNNTGGPSKTPTAASSSSASASAPPAPDHCAGNGLPQLVEVSISARHMWACQGAKTVYDSPVVTGMEMYAADKTPVGTYHIYNKQTNLTLTGSDSTGSWNDPVSYWMQFLRNGYGAYGFHDATWRTNNQFGNISPDSAQASHGCVELPLATAAWLYNWSQIGTTVNISS